jgi:DNA repair exonuclease SbcCD ATPase subunit
MSMKNLEAAQQRVANAKAELGQLKVERIEVEGRAAKAEADKLTAKADPRAFKAVCTRLSDARDELERIGMLIADAESQLKAAEVDAEHASFALEAASVAASAASAAKLGAVFAIAAGEYLGQLRALRTAIETADHSIARLEQRALRLDTSFDASQACAQLSSVRELLAIAPKTEALHYALTGARHTANIEAVANAMCSSLRLRKPAAGMNYAAASRVLDMLSGEYTSRLEVFEVVGDAADVN